MKTDVSSLLLQIVMGAAVTQTLLLVLSVQFSTLGFFGTIPGFSGFDGDVLAALQPVNLLLFGIFDLVGGIGFAALINGKLGTVVQVGD